MKKKKKKLVARKAVEKIDKAMAGLPVGTGDIKIHTVADPGLAPAADHGIKGKKNDKKNEPITKDDSNTDPVRAGGGTAGDPGTDPGDGKPSFWDDLPGF